MSECVNRTQFQYSPPLLPSLNVRAEDEATCFSIKTGGVTYDVCTMAEERTEHRT